MPSCRSHLFCHVYGLSKRTPKGSTTSLRREAGLDWGVFPRGTLIQLDEKGTVAPIETLVGGDLIWNPNLKRQVILRMTIVGNENGKDIYTFHTEGGLSVRVTETHPMKINKDPFDSKTVLAWENKPAKNVNLGDWVETVNGVQQITRIEKTEAKDVEVWNLEYFALHDVPMTLRAVVSDGIYTLDFAAQKVHQN